MPGHLAPHEIGEASRRIQEAAKQHTDDAIGNPVFERANQVFVQQVLADRAALYLDQAAGSSALQMHNWVGQHIPLHATSNGKVRT